MKSRWCVIAGPRSGSTWFEGMILKFLKTKDTSFSLGEFMHPGLSNVLKQDWVLDDQGNLVKKENIKPCITEQDFFNKRSQLIFDNNSNQQWTMRLFCQPRAFPWFNYINFIEKLLTKNVNFVCLKRPSFDRSISWYFMNNTGVVHKRRKENSFIFYSRTNGSIIKSEKLELTPIEINLKSWENIFNNCIEEDFYLNKIINHFNFPVVNYENVIDDCKENNIPIDYNNTAIFKLYEERYQDNILNYSNLIDHYHSILEKLDLDRKTVIVNQRTNMLNVREK